MEEKTQKIVDAIIEERDSKTVTRIFKEKLETRQYGENPEFSDAIARLSKLWNCGRIEVADKLGLI